MNPAIYIAILIPLFLLILQQNNEKKLLLKRMIKTKNRNEVTQMLELAKRFIGKECLIYTFNSQLTGTITEVTDGAILIDDKKAVEAVNLDFVVRIREYPRGKNGKKKSLILD